MGLWALSRKTKLPGRAALATNLLAVAAVAQVKTTVHRNWNFTQIHQFSVCMFNIFW